MRLQRHLRFLYNRDMKQKLSLHLTRWFSRAAAFMLCVALLTACSAAPEALDPDVLADEDSSSESSSVETLETIPPERVMDVTAQPIESLLSADGFAILFVNVGKADAAIIRFGETAILIDTGSAESAPQLLAGLNALGISKIDKVFITHSHSDHLGGLDALSANVTIPMVYSAFFAEADKNGVGKIVKRAEKLGLNHKELMAGDVVSVTDDVSFAVLGPLSLNEDDDNDNSLVLQFSYGGKTFLFTGDMQFIEEEAILDSGVSLKSDVLKVGNHGNPDATGDAFGAQVSPAFAVISTNTAEDTDSANPRVYAALPSAQIAVTQEYPIGVLLTLSASGEIVLANPAREAAQSMLVISEFDVEKQTVTLFNSTVAPADLSGMILFSVRSDAALRFPEGTLLGAGETLVIGESGALSFPGEDKPLSKKKDNTVILYNRLGALVSKLEQ